MTWRFGSGLFVIPNLFRDLVFWLTNLGLKAPLFGRGSLLKMKNSVTLDRSIFKVGRGSSAKVKGNKVIAAS
jgi:hypothetical protein